jgi:hypothetical protein
VFYYHIVRFCFFLCFPFQQKFELICFQAKKKIQTNGSENVAPTIPRPQNVGTSNIVPQNVVTSTPVSNSGSSSMVRRISAEYNNKLSTEEPKPTTVTTLPTRPKPISEKEIVKSSSENSFKSSTFVASLLSNEPQEKSEQNFRLGSIEKPPRHFAPENESNRRLLNEDVEKKEPVRRSSNENVENRRLSSENVENRRLSGENIENRRFADVPVDDSSMKSLFASLEPSECRKMEEEFEKLTSSVDVEDPDAKLEEILSENVAAAKNKVKSLVNT